MINLNELSAVLKLTEGDTMYGAAGGSSPLKYDNEGEIEGGRELFLPAAYDTPLLLTSCFFAPSSFTRPLKCGNALGHLNRCHPKQS